LKIRIVAPSGKTDKKGVETGISLLQKFGINSVKGENLFFEDGYFAGTDSQRLEDLQKALSSPSEKVIWLARGGYGLGRIIDSLDWKLFLDYPKWIIGYSDTTFLLVEAVNRGFPCIHGPMLQSVDQLNDEIVLAIKEIIGNGEYSISWDSSKYDLQGKVEGSVCGGNLSMICSVIGTNSEPDWRKFILFLEEVNEPFHKLDRMLNHLDRTGIFSKIQALIVGEFPDFDLGGRLGGMEEMILEKTRGVSYPISFGFPAGHGKKNYPIPFGIKLKYCVGKNNELLKIQ
jgi:muramoyltetrapeptide carboxypeptidase